MKRVRQSVGSADMSNVSVCPQDTNLYRRGDGDLDAAAHVRFTSSNPPDSIDKNSHFSSQTSISQSVYKVRV